MLSSPRRITYLNYLEIEFLWNYCNLYAVYCCYEKRFRFRLSCFDEFFLTLMSEGASSSSAGGGSLFTFEKCTWLTGRPRLCSSSGLSWSWPEVAFGGSISTSMWILIGEDCWKKRYSFKGLTQMIRFLANVILRIQFPFSCIRIYSTYSFRVYFKSFFVIFAKKVLF